MTVAAVAIDCGWLCCLDGLDYDRTQNALLVLRELEVRGIPLLLDSGGHIVREYERNLRGSMLGQKFIKAQFKRGRFGYFGGAPLQECARALAAIGFDPNDAPYVGVAQRGGGVYLTHEEKHLDLDRCDAVSRNCGVTIVDAERLAALLT